MSRAADVLARRTMPRLVVAASRIDWPARLGARLRRRLGRRATVELYFAFDDPCSAWALIELAERTANRDVRLLPLPVVTRGIPRDPAVEQKRLYALADARRRSARSGLTLARAEPLDPSLTAFLAEWVAAAKPGPSLGRFCADAVRELWFTRDGALSRPRFEALWRTRLGTPPPDANSRGVGRNEQRMRGRGAYDTPAAWVHGHLFFAHDRLAQIEHRLDELGWTVTA